MTISDGIKQIIMKRKEKVPKLQSKRQHLQEVLDVVERINAVKQDMLDNADRLKLSAEIQTAIQEIGTSSFRNAMNALLDFYNTTILRFSREEINIAVVGGARQGKSQLLQSISNLDNMVIPAFLTDDCTGASSVIKNVPGMPLSAHITFRSEVEMVRIVQEYLDNIFGAGVKTIGSFEGIRGLEIDQLEKIVPSEKRAKFEHLKKYVRQFDMWSKCVRMGETTISDPVQIQKYVAQHNGKKETEPERENYYYYLAVKEAVISCPFNNPETGNIVLRDTIGLGDTSIGIGDKMLDTIGIYSDAAIVVRRPEPATGKFDETDELLYMQLKKAFSRRNMDKWLFWMVNHTTDGPNYRDNLDRCQAYKKKIDSFEWDIAGSRIVDASDQAKVDEFLQTVLETLIKNIDAVDEGILSEIHRLSEVAYEEFKKVNSSLRNVLLQGVSDEVDTTDFLDNRWTDLYNRGFMKKLKEYRDELFDRQDEECEAFKRKVQEILDNSRALVPTQEMFYEDLSMGAVQPIQVYTRNMNAFRTNFTEQFLNIDEVIFDQQVHDFKEHIAQVFTANESGKLSNLLSIDDYDDKGDWFRDFAERFFTKERYAQLKTAFFMMHNFTLSVRGFLMHRIRSRIDRLNPDEFRLDPALQSDQDKAAALHRSFDVRFREVREELNALFEQELFREPNRIFYAIMSEFYDRLSFSYEKKNRKGMDKVWENFYREHIMDVWSDEFRESMKASAIYKGWSELSSDFAKITRQDFMSE